MLNIINRKAAISFLIFALSYGIASAGEIQQDTVYKVNMADGVFASAELAINQIMHGGL